jgi:acyl-CoA dehydrogenase
MFLSDGHRELAEKLRDVSATMPMFGLATSEVVARLRASSLFALLVPAADGGHAISKGHGACLDIRALCLARETLAYQNPMADSIFAVQGLGAHAVVKTPEFEGRGEFLAAIVSGAKVGAFALTEPEAGSDIGSMRSVATAGGTGDRASFSVTGEKVYISNVGIADHYLVFANADPSLGKKGISCFLVPNDAKGLTLEPIALSGDHPLGRLRLDACMVPKSKLVGQIGHGLRLALGTLDTFRVTVGAAACGMAQRALDETLCRVRARVQFGKSLAEFQLTQAALAEMATELEAARLLVYRAAWKKDNGVSATIDVAMAKMYATEAAQRIIDRAVQLHGGSGVVLGSVVETLYREIRPLRIYEGTTEIQKLIIGGALVAGSLQHKA